MITLDKWSLMEGKWARYRGGQFSVGECTCYGGGQFNGGRMVMLQRWSLMEGEWSLQWSV